MIDVFSVPETVTSLSFAPNGDFLATSHVSKIGIYLWTNKAQFANVGLKAISVKDVINLALPSCEEVADDTQGKILLMSKRE